MRDRGGCAAVILAVLSALMLQAAFDREELHAQGLGAEAAFMEIPLGARALGLGGAYAAVADDGAGFFWNPAGISLVDHKLLSGMYASQYGPIGSPFANYYFAGWTMPIDSGTAVSGNWIRLAVTDIPYFPDITSLGSPQEREQFIREHPEGFGTFSDIEDAFVLGIAHNIRTTLDFGWAYFSVPLEFPVGANVKYVRQSLGEFEASGIGLDLGAMMRVDLKDFFFSEGFPALVFAIAVRDVGTTRINWTDAHRGAGIPQRVTVGFSVTQPILPLDGALMLAADFDDTEQGGTRLGAEFRYRKQVSFRCGVNDASVTAGAGVDFNFFDIDYSLMMSSREQLGGVHRVGIAFNFDTLLEQ